MSSAGTVSPTIKDGHRMTAKTHGRKGRPWRRLREQVLREERLCYMCGKRPSTVVDHVLPMSKFPHLAHVRSNLRGACRNCNASKSNRLLRPRTTAAVTQLKW